MSVREDGRLVMFRNSNAFSGFSVDDLVTAKDFYDTTLGLETEVNAMGIMTLRLATGARGITFEKYDSIRTDEKGIHRDGGPLIAWFKDPAGNILSVIQDPGPR